MEFHRGAAPRKNSVDGVETRFAGSQCSQKRIGREIATKTQGFHRKLEKGSKGMGHRNAFFRHSLQNHGKIGPKVTRTKYVGVAYKGGVPTTPSAFGGERKFQRGAVDPVCGRRRTGKGRCARSLGTGQGAKGKGQGARYNGKGRAAGAGAEGQRTRGKVQGAMEMVKGTGE